MRSKPSQWRWFVGFLATTAALFAVMDCASVPVQRESFLVVPVENQYLEQVVIYVNGARVAQLEAMESRTLFIRESLLRGGRCAEAVAFLKASNLRLHSTEECLSRGGYFTLSVALSGHLWLNPWR